MIPHFISMALLGVDLAGSWIFPGEDVPGHGFRERLCSFDHLSDISTPSWLLRSTLGFIQLCKLWENNSSVSIAWRQETQIGLVVQIEKSASSSGREESSHPNMTTPTCITVHKLHYRGRKLCLSWWNNMIFHIYWLNMTVFVFSWDNLSDSNEFKLKD